MHTHSLPTTKIATAPRARLLVGCLVVGLWAALPVGASAEDAPVAGSRDLLERFGIDQSQFDRLIDGRPISDGETEALLKIMFRLPQINQVNLHQWASRDWTAAGLFEDAESHRGQTFYLAGQVRRVDTHEPLPEVAARFELPRYFRCELVLAESEQPAVVYVRKVPDPWRIGEPVDYRVTGYGLLLKFASETAEQPKPVFVAERLGWHPPTLLGKLGMDVGLFDEIEHQKGLTSRDREAFYQMLAAVGRAKSGQLRRKAQEILKESEPNQKRSDSDTFSVVPLFNDDPDSQVGRLVVLEGAAKRVARIRINDPDILARFGIDHYYEIALFPHDSQDNPVFFCVRDLPKGMPTGDGPRYAEQVRVAGFYFKKWAYRVDSSDPAAQTDPAKPTLQLAPLLIGRQPVWYPHKAPERNTFAGAIAGGLFVLALLGIWFVLWRLNRRDREFESEILGKMHAPESGLPLNQIDLDAEGHPDFSHLDEESTEPTSESQKDQTE